MKAIKFISQDEPSINSLIQQIQSEVDLNNNVLIRWQWPRDNSVKMVVVYQANTGEESLTELLESDINPVIITKGMEGSYNKQLERESAIFKLFPACFGKDGDVLVLNQKEGNTTHKLFAKISVYYSISYKNIPFSQLQRVFINLEISSQNNFMPDVRAEDLLVYEKNAGGYTISYPIDETAVSSGLTLYVKKNERVYLKPKAIYENIVSLHEEV